MDPSPDVISPGCYKYSENGSSRKVPTISVPVANTDVSMCGRVFV